MPPQLYFVGSAIFHYLGPAFAVLLFARVDVLGVAWLRIASAALVFAAVRRPWRRAAVRSRDVVVLGVLLAVMNACFYLAIDRLPLGTVAAILLFIVLGSQVVPAAIAGVQIHENASTLEVAFLARLLALLEKPFSLLVGLLLDLG